MQAFREVMFHGSAFFIGGRMIQGALKLAPGDRLLLKKAHPCGSAEWEVARAGADVKLKCLGCGHIVMIDRAELRKKIKKILLKEEA